MRGGQNLFLEKIPFLENQKKCQKYFLFKIWNIKEYIFQQNFFKI